MAEQAAGKAGEQTGAVEAAASSHAIEAGRVEAPSIAPDHEAPPKPDAPRIEPPKFAAASGTDAKAETEAAAERKPGKLIVMPPADRSWDREGFGPHVKADQPRETAGKRRLSAMAAVVAIAAGVGALSGALATGAVMRFAAPAAAPVQVADTSALDASVARIDADLVALKANVEQTSKTGLSQYNRTSDRLDKLEKAQAEPIAKIARLSEAVDKLRAAPPAAAAAPAQAAAGTPARETTGSIAPAPAVAAAPPPAAPKTEVGRLPTIEGWRLRDVANGGALIEGRGGLYEVYAGDPIPGVGRVDAIRRQDGRWVVVTPRGLIVAR
jgi:hypothetical protein